MLLVPIESFISFWFLFFSEWKVVYIFHNLPYLSGYWFSCIICRGFRQSETFFLLMLSWVCSVLFEAFSKTCAVSYFLLFVLVNVIWYFSNCHKSLVQAWQHTTFSIAVSFPLYYFQSIITPKSIEVVNCVTSELQILIFLKFSALHFCCLSLWRLFWIHLLLIHLKPRIVKYLTITSSWNLPLLVSSA